MLRRFETYRLRPDVSKDAGAELESALANCSRFISEVLDAAVGWNLTASTPVDLVWEHAYENTEAYGRYMRHPYHICILDRYLLPDSPEWVLPLCQCRALRVAGGTGGTFAHGGVLD